MSETTDEERELRMELERRRAALTAAEVRSRGLLLSHLTPEQWRTFEVNNWFVVEGGRSRVKYRIRGGNYAGNVYALGADGETAISRYCAHLAGNIPLHDHLLAQKIMIEVDEDSFHVIANRQPV